jgi:hypothetical protein
MKIDLSQIITAEDKADAEQARRRAGINAERDRGWLLTPRYRWRAMAILPCRAVRATRST